MPKGSSVAPGLVLWLRILPILHPHRRLRRRIWLLAPLLIIALYMIRILLEIHAGAFLANPKRLTPEQWVLA